MNSNESSALLHEAIRKQNAADVASIAKTITSSVTLNKALKDAAWWGMEDVVEALLPYTNPKAYDSAPLQWAVKGRHEAVAVLLFPKSDVEAAKAGLDDLDHAFLEQAALKVA